MLWQCHKFLTVTVLWIFTFTCNRKLAISKFFTHLCFFLLLLFKWTFVFCYHLSISQALVSFKKYMPSPLPYFKVNICPFPLPHFASICFAYLWSFRWPNYIVTLPRYFSFRLPHLNIPTGNPSDELDKTIQRKWLGENLSHWNGYNHFRFALDFSYAFGIL